MSHEDAHVSGLAMTPEAIISDDEGDFEDSDHEIDGVEKADVEAITDQDEVKATVVSESESGDEDHVPAKHGGGLSIVTDLKEERKRLTIVTFAVASGAASYIMMLFLAMPVSIHLIVNQSNGCNPETDVACFSPTADSQTQLTLTLTLLRLFTFLMGSFVGTVSDRYGRRPMLILALLGYSTTAVLFLIGWVTQSLALFILGAIILGASSPITPHGVAYISDISPPDRLARNLGILQGGGYFAGLMFGAIVGLTVSILALGVEEETGSAGIEAYDRFFYGSYGSGLVLSMSSAITMMLFLPEPLHKEERTTSIDIKKANPLGFAVMVSRNPYIFSVWLCAFVAWTAVGAGESVTGGWWLRRYVMTDLKDFIIFVVVLWSASGFGSVILTGMYVKAWGLKGALHVSAIFTVLVGFALGFAPTVPTSYIAVVVSFFAAPVYALILALLMGQVGPLEKGALAGALRGSEALGKMIGIIGFGNAFASYIQEFTPDSSCVPDEPLAGGANDCDCGIETCPILTPQLLADNTTALVPTIVPSVCSLGQLSVRLIGKPSKFTEVYTPENPAVTLGLLPPAFLESGALSRPEGECVGSGLTQNDAGFETSIGAIWCIGAPVPSNTGLPNATVDALNANTDLIQNAVLGCPGFNFAAAANPLAREAFYGAEGSLMTPEKAGQVVAAILSTDEDRLEQIEELCPDVKLNVCLLGPIASVPGLFPLLYLSGLGALSYLFFVIGEMCFVKNDKRFWTTKQA